MLLIIPSLYGGVKKSICFLTTKMIWRLTSIRQVPEYIVLETKNI
jgi:hypothetical protein